MICATDVLAQANPKFQDQLSQLVSEARSSGPYEGTVGHVPLPADKPGENGLIGLLSNSIRKLVKESESGAFARTFTYMESTAFQPECLMPSHSRFPHFLVILTRLLELAIALVLAPHRLHLMTELSFHSLLTRIQSRIMSEARTFADNHQRRSVHSPESLLSSEEASCP